MDIPVLEALPREESGTQACRRMRRQGLVPAVLYGRGEPNIMIAVQSNAVAQLLDEHQLIMDVRLEGQSSPAQLKEIQYDALGDDVIHLDLGRISLSETVDVAVRVETHGEAVGVKEGGVLEVVLHELQVQCLPTAIPENIRVEVEALNIGDDLRVRDLTLPEGVKALAEEDAVVVLCAHPVVIEEEAVPEEEALAEPEVIGKAAEGEEEGEEEEDQAPKADGA